MGSSFLKEFFWNIYKIKDFGSNFLGKGHILMPFSGIAPTKMKMLSKNLRLQYVYIYINDIKKLF